MNITCPGIRIQNIYVFFLVFHTSNSLRLVTMAIISIKHIIVAFQHAFPYKNINEDCWSSMSIYNSGVDFVRLVGVLFTCGGKREIRYRHGYYDLET